MHIETLKYERIINDALIARITSLLAALKSHAAEVEAKTRTPAEVAFAAVMESAAGLKPEDDQPPPRPEGVHGSEEKMPTYSKMMATLLDQVNTAMEEKAVTQDERFDAMVKEIEEHLKKVTDLQGELHNKLAELEKEAGKKITSDGLREGFSSSHVNKSPATAAPAGGKKEELELLNPNYSAPQTGESSKSTAADEDDEHIEASPAASEFAKIKMGDYNTSMAFLSKNHQLLSERESDSLLMLAFDAQLEGRDEFARQCVHQALLLQYCRALGRDGVALFHKRLTTPGHQAKDVFYKDVQETYNKIKTRAVEINKERAARGAQEDVEQIQLHAVEPGTVINITIPPANGATPEEQAARAVFDNFSPKMKQALESGSLEAVNKVLGDLPVAEAEELVEKFGEAGVLSLENEIVDTTTSEGQAQWKQMQEQGKATTEEEFPDPE